MNKIKDLPKDFDLNHQWGLFLERCGISAITMPEDQHREMKRAFFGACGQLLILLRDEVGDYGDKHGDAAAAYNEGYGGSGVRVLAKRSRQTIW